MRYTYRRALSRYVHTRSHLPPHRPPHLLAGLNVPFLKDGALPTGRAFPGRGGLCGCHTNAYRLPLLRCAAHLRAFCGHTARHLPSHKTAFPAPACDTWRARAGITAQHPLTALHYHNMT